jgi:hypothetical protein
MLELHIVLRGFGIVNIARPTLARSIIIHAFAGS